MKPYLILNNKCCWSGFILLCLTVHVIGVCAESIIKNEYIIPRDVDWDTFVQRPFKYWQPHMFP